MRSQVRSLSRPPTSFAPPAIHSTGAPPNPQRAPQESPRSHIRDSGRARTPTIAGSNATRNSSFLPVFTLLSTAAGKPNSIAAKTQLVERLHMPADCSADRSPRHRCTSANVRLSVQPVNRKAALPTRRVARSAGARYGESDTASRRELARFQLSLADCLSPTGSFRVSISFE